jgi:glycosyltransferase involved in cell wall biosynthesis
MIKASDISLCITAYNSPGVLKRTLDAISKMDLLPGEVIICDDGSTDESVREVRSICAGLKIAVRHLWHPDEGWRISASRNMGIRHSKGDYLIFIDGDCLPHRKFVEDHARHAEENCFFLGDRCHVIEERIRGFRPRNPHIWFWMLAGWIQKRSLAMRDAHAEVIRLRQPGLSGLDIARTAIGCNLAFWREDALRVNGFNEGIIGWGLEDIEFCARLLNLGLTAKKVKKQALLFHLNHPTTEYDEESALRPTRAAVESGQFRTEKGLDEAVEKGRELP